MEQTVNFAIVSVYIVLFLGISMAVARWQERRYGCEDDSPEEQEPPTKGGGTNNKVGER